MVFAYELTLCCDCTKRIQTNIIKFQPTYDRCRVYFIRSIMQHVARLRIVINIPRMTLNTSSCRDTNSNLTLTLSIGTNVTAMRLNANTFVEDDLILLTRLKD